MSYQVYIDGNLTACKSGNGGAKKDEIIAEIERRKAKGRDLSYAKSWKKEQLCKVLVDDDKASGGVKKKEKKVEKKVEKKEKKEVARPTSAKPPEKKKEEKIVKRPQTAAPKSGKVTFSFFPSPISRKDSIGEDIPYTILKAGTECQDLAKPVRSKAQTETIRAAIHHILSQGYDEEGGYDEGEEEEEPETPGELSQHLLQEMFRLYDWLFFNEQISRAAAEKKHTFHVEVSSKMTKTAGICKYRPGGSPSGSQECTITIGISKPIYDQLFAKGEKNHRMGGLLCVDKLDCIQKIFEHELVHALINIFCNDVMIRAPGPERTGDKSPVRRKGFVYHPQIFKDIVHSQFGHTEFRHDLLAGEGSEVEKKLEHASNIKAQLYKGARVIVNTRGGPMKATIDTKPKVNAKTITLTLDNGAKLKGVGFQWIEKILDPDEDEEELPPIKEQKKVTLTAEQSTVEGLKRMLSKGSRVLINIDRKQIGATLLVKPTLKANVQRVSMQLDDGRKLLVPYSYIVLKSQEPKEISLEPLQKYLSARLISVIKKFL